MQLNEQRKRFVDLTKKQLTGAGLKLKDDVLVGLNPLDRFFTGFLFPVSVNDELLDDDIEVEDYASSTDEQNDQAKIEKKHKRYLPPSSAGFSFFISGSPILLRIYYNAVHYKCSEERDSIGRHIPRKWNKQYLADDGKEVEFTPDGIKQHLVFNGKAKIDSIWRPYNDGYIVTITMSNNQCIEDTQDGKKDKIEQNEKTLFEVEFKCIIESGDIDVYPSKDKSLLDDEEREIEFRYKNLHIYAVGHGTAVNWHKSTNDQMEIWTDFLPTVEVPQVTADTVEGYCRTLQYTFLGECEKNKDVITELNDFVNKYEFWIESQNGMVSNEVDDDKDTAKKIIDKLIIAKDRMSQSVDILRNDKNARQAFSIANNAMLEQWISADANKGSVKSLAEYAWRPFQLGFILTTLESSINEDSEYRDMVDLIWFPTGGGKTEAYLGLMVFLFVYRRLTFPASSGGTVSIMRYTLRLLTSQQFLRASKVICALELIRQRNTEMLGQEPFTVGLWVGQASTPNTFSEAIKLIEKKDFSKFTLKKCPWCGSEFSESNYIVSGDNFHFTCRNKMCDFGREKNNILPCNVVDEALYKNPPSLLISTVDKFARLAWEGRAGSFFGNDGNRAPELIIQDELHLISSAIGSIVALYEAAIDTVLVSRGIRAKYIASTATIKNATKQIQSLFAKEMSIFPPPGLSYNDSYFAKTVPLNIKAGRLYVGYLAPLLSKQRSIEPLAAALLSNPIKLFKHEEVFIDKWWTHIVYHGSLKGVGNSRTLYQSGVRSYLDQFTLENLREDIESDFPGFLEGWNLRDINSFEKIDNIEVKSIISQYIPTRDVVVKTLTSNQTAEENAVVFDALAKEKNEGGTIDVALATNMISVGLDVPRLALIIINGQPLTTAEYIQASSRIGRGDTPGIVFVNYYKTQARSLSHYENFKSYHDSFYRFVEPSSLTPFTYQARSRALHAALVIAMRHSNIGLLYNESAGDFNSDNDLVKKVIKELKIRCKLAIGIESQKLITKTNEHIDKLVTDWMSESNFCKENRVKLVYSSNDRSFNNLICNFEDKNGLWQTLQSMRNVESSALFKIIERI